MDGADDVLDAAAPGGPDLSPEKMQELKALLDKMKAGLADMSEEDQEEFRQGFVHKLADKVRMAGAAESQRAAAAGLGQGVVVTLVSLLILITLFALVGYKIYQYVNQEEKRRNVKGRTKSLKPSKRKEKKDK